MLDKLKSRGVLISAVAFVAMVIIFVAHQQLVREQTAGTTPVIETQPVEVASLEPAPVVEETDSVEPAPPAPEPPREITYEEAEAAYLDKRYEAAVELFAGYADRKFENPWGFYMLGLSAWKAGQHERAELAFEQAIDLDSTHVKSYINLGRTLLDAGKPTYALVRVHEALELDPESGAALRLLGRVNRNLGKTDEAIDAYRQAIQIDNDDAWSMNNLGLVLIEEGRYEEALHALARATGLRDDVAVFYNNLGMALELNGDFRQATEVYELALGIDPGHEKASDNFNRVATVLQDPETEPVDLEIAAQRFVDGIASWGETVVASDTPDPVEPIADPAPIAVSEPDTTTGGQEQ
jgi:tetratricopeptide (TPR) repeat protein